MKKILLLSYWLLGSIEGYCQQDKQLLIVEVGQLCKVVSYELEQGKMMNVVIEHQGKNYRYGKWKFYYPTGEVSSDGFFSIIKRIDKNASVFAEPVQQWWDEKPVGKWHYYTQEGKPRIDLLASEPVNEGYFRIYSEEHLVVEGQFEDGQLINGRKYSYQLYEGYSPKTHIYQHGQEVQSF